MSVQDEIEKFVNSEDNSSFFKLEEINSEKFTFSIDSDYKFQIIILDEGKHEIKTEETFLKEWKEEMNKFCKEGKKTITELLNKVKKKKC